MTILRKQILICQSDLPKETESPRFQALLRMTGGPRKGKASDIKSFSHELDPRGVRSYEFLRPNSLHELEVCACFFRVLLASKSWSEENQQ